MTSETVGDSSRPARPLAAGGALLEALTLVRRLCAPLAFLHGEGIVHCDLKPANILVRPGGMPVLVDFGLVSHFAREVSRETLEVAEPLVGTVAYMAPEQARGELLDARADLYALGCILYELLTGRPPFLGRTPARVLRQHVEAEPLAPSQLAEDVPLQLDELVLRLLAKSPRQRLGHADDVAAALERLGAQDGLAAVGPRPRAYLYRPGLAGREELLGELDATLERLDSGVGAVVLIGGESGVGKTRLAMELAQRAERRDMRVLTGECLDRVARPLESLRRPMQVIADRCRARGKSETDRLLGSRGKLMAQYEPALLGLPGQEAYTEPAELPAEAARLRLFAFLTQTLGALAEEAPVLLVLDDLQWADDLTLGFLESCLRAALSGARRALPLLVVGTYRTEELGEALRKLLGAPAVQRVELGRLNETAVATMVGDMLALEPPPQLFVRFLSRHSEGNPFFVAEYLRAGVAEELLWRDEQGHWQVAEAGESRALEADYEQLPLPRSLRQLVERRLQGLEEAAHRLVEAAAVAGREVGASLLRQMLPMAESPLLEALADLLRRQVFEDAGVGELRFVHDKIREVAYGRIDPARRPQLHRAAAEGIEALLVPQEHQAALGHHWEQAGELLRARQCYLTAAQQAQGHYAYHEAERLYRGYLRLVEEPMEASTRARNELADGILRIQGRNLEALEEHDLALEEARELGDRLLEAQTLRALGVVQLALGHWDKVGALYEQALAIARDIGHGKTESQTLGDLASFLRIRGLLKESQSFVEQAIAIDRDLGDLRSEGTHLSQLAIVHHDQGHLAEERKLCEQAIDIACETGDRRTEGLTRNNLGTWYHDRERLEEARTCYEQALAIAREIGHRRLEATLLVNLASILAEQGRPEEARRLYEQGLTLLREVGERRFEGWTLVWMAALARRVSRMAEAEPLLERAELLLREVGAWPFVVECLCERSHSLLAAGRPARMLMEQAQSLATELQVVSESRLGQTLAKLQRAVEAFEARRPLFRGECLDDLPEGLLRWLAETRQLAGSGGQQGERREPEASGASGTPPRRK